MFLITMNQLKGDIRPILFRFGVALALSFTGFLYSRIRSRRVKPLLPPPPSPRDSGHDNGKDVRSDDISTFSARRHRITISSIAEQNDEIYHRSRRVIIGNSLAAPKSTLNAPSGDKRGFLLPEISAAVKELDFSQTPQSSLTVVDKDTYREEIEQLKNTVRMLREQEVNLEARLLEYYGLKEEEAAAMELQNRLKLKNMEVKLLSLKIESLKKVNSRLEQQVADRAKVVSDLEIARSKIRVLKKKLRSEAEQNREQILQLQKRVEKLHIEDVDSGAAEVNLIKLKQLEHGVEELKETNTRLRMENVDLVQRLESTQILANCVLEDPQTEALKRETKHLRRENETLTKEVDRLQVDRCSDVEELVYLRWINACLRYELRNYEPLSGKTGARDLSKTLSPKSEEKAKHLILEYAEVAPPDKVVDFDSDEWPSSRFSYSGELDVSSSSEKMNSSGKKKKKLFGKLQKLLLGKDGHEENPSPNPNPNKPELQELVRDTSSSDSSSSSNMGTRHSLDIHKLRRLKMEDGKDSELKRRNSDLGSVQTGELAKYAKVLKDSWVPKKSKLYKKSASVGSFQSLVKVT